MFFAGTLTGICAILTNLNHDLSCMNDHIYARMNDRMLACMNVGVKDLYMIVNYLS